MLYQCSICRQSYTIAPDNGSEYAGHKDHPQCVLRYYGDYVTEDDVEYADQTTVIAVAPFRTWSGDTIVPE